VLRFDNDHWWCKANGAIHRHQFIDDCRGRDQSLFVIRIILEMVVMYELHSGKRTMIGFKKNLYASVFKVI